MFEARLKAGFRWPTIRSCNGTVFTKDSWRAIPLGREAEAKGNEFLDVREVKQLPAEVKTKAPAADALIPIEDGAAELAASFGIDLDLREGPGAVVPTKTKGITVSRVGS